MTPQLLQNDTCEDGILSDVFDVLRLFFFFLYLFTPKYEAQSIIRDIHGGTRHLTNPASSLSRVPLSKSVCRFLSHSKYFYHSRIYQFSQATSFAVAPLTSSKESCLFLRQHVRYIWKA